MTELECLAYKYDTDKGSHGYCPHYERFIGEFRFLPITMIEIGVAQGNSLRMWRDWMPGATIYGLDINGYEGKETHEFTVIRGHQNDGHDLEEMLKTTGKPNIVIDDAGHDPAHQKTSFNYIFPKMITGGWYVIEDSFGLSSLIDLDSVAGGNSDIEELHLISMNSGDVIGFFKKR